MKEITFLNIIESIAAYDDYEKKRRRLYFPRTIMCLQKKLYYGRKTQKNGLQFRAGV